MATVKKRARKHNPELLRAKRAARALNLRWADVIRERDRLRQNELDQRGHEDEAREVAWGRTYTRVKLNRGVGFDARTHGCNSLGVPFV